MDNINTNKQINKSKKYELQSKNKIFLRQSI